MGYGAMVDGRAPIYLSTYLSVMPRYIGLRQESKKARTITREKWQESWEEINGQRRVGLRIELFVREISGNSLRAWT